jgi:hypothetical protein
MKALALIPILTDVDVCRSNFEALFLGGYANTQIDGGELIWFDGNTVRHRY